MKYRLKRKTYGMVGNVVGTALQATGSVADSAAGKVVGGLAGAGAGIAAAGWGNIIPGVTPVAALVGGLVGAKGASALGKAAKQSGKDLRLN